MKRRGVLILLGAGLAVPCQLFAQAKVRRVGVLALRSRSTPSSPDTGYDAFVQGMRDLGYAEGRNLGLEWRFAEGKIERLPELAAELVRAKPEVILTHGTPGALAAMRATSTIPVVFAGVGDPVKSGIAKSLARPGGNITGLSLVTGDLAPKQIDLLKSILPKGNHLAHFRNPDNPSSSIAQFEAAAQQAGLKILRINARNPDELAHGFETARKTGAQAAIIVADGVFIVHRRLIAGLALKHKLPTMHYFREDVLEGGLIAYGQNTPEYFRRSAAYVDKILNGAKPGDLPIEQPSKIHLAINLKTAKALGLNISKELRFRADEVIE